MRHSIGRE
jgi:signal-transduction protein with cAMP-binding, CBS, and nucleotidyltransferase domain